MRNEDSCLYTKKCIDDSYVILILYVDDMLIVGKNKDSLVQTKEKIESNFRHEKFRKFAKHILGMCILKIGVMSVFICLNLNTYAKCPKTLLWRVQNL